MPLSIHLVIVWITLALGPSRGSVPCFAARTLLSMKKGVKHVCTDRKNEILAPIPFTSSTICVSSFSRCLQTRPDAQLKDLMCRSWLG
ncbi:hypothetical protein K474DRAFT_919923 [Panus rudis PR-1116 ss-1]|nr:hypothetical protein K474DRAFT_919923 [Panus rudis PR-1116 ss-1]